MSDSSEHRLRSTNLEQYHHINIGSDGSTTGTTTITNTGSITAGVPIVSTPPAVATNIITARRSSSSHHNDESSTATAAVCTPIKITSNKILPIAISAPLSLPDRRIMDHKNTLHSSFVGIDGNSGINNNITSTLKPPVFTLPDGRLIDGKNTLQSFDTLSSSLVWTPQLDLATSRQKKGGPPVASTQPQTAIAVAETLLPMANTATNTHDNDDPVLLPHVEGTMTVHAEAVAVVDAEVADSRLEPFRHLKQRSVLFWLIMLLVLVAVSTGVGVGVYCGAGNCSSSTSPAVTPASMTTTIPTTPTIDSHLTVACEFLNTPNLSECQNLTLFRGKSLATKIPTEIGLLTQLTYLDLNDDQLTGTVPSILGNLMQLTYLDLSMNQMTGTIPLTIGKLTLLDTLLLTFNRLTGTIPSVLANLTQIKSLALGHNNFVGSIPSIWGHLLRLTFLTFHQTYQLTGTIPSSIGLLTQLKALLLHDCQLSGNIPLLFGKLTQLTHLDLGSNRLNGTIPSTLGSLTKLNYLYLGSNQLTGTLSSTLGNLTQLNDFNLYGNQLTGTIPSTLGNLTQLNDFNLYGNQLTGTIPSSLCTLSGIVIQIECANFSCTCCQDSTLSSCPSK